MDFRFAIASKAGSPEDSVLDKMYLIRSYDQFRQSSLIHSSPKVFSWPRRSSRNISREMNYGKAQPIECWQVARAAIASPFHFEPLKIEDDLSDFPKFSFPRSMNPTRVAQWEVQNLCGDTGVGVVVSIGTAFRVKKIKLGTSRIPISLIPDYETVHESFTKDHDFPYYRLNDPDGLEITDDDWRPRQSLFGQDSKDCGSQTISTITRAFDRWASSPDTIKQFRKCAYELVARRRKRMCTEKWARYAVGARYQCRKKGCDAGDFIERRRFMDHLSKTHFVEEGEDMDNEVRQCYSRWQYNHTPERDMNIYWGEVPKSVVVRAQDQGGTKTKSFVSPESVLPKTVLPEFVVDRGNRNLEVDESKSHLQDPDAYFSALQDLEINVAIDCQLKELFPDVREGVCHSVDIERAIPARLFESTLPYGPALWRDVTLKVSIASQTLLTGVLHAFHRLQAYQFCGNTFNLIIASSTRSLVAKIIPISGSILENISRLIDEAIRDLRDQSNRAEESLKTVETASEWTLNYLGLSVSPVEKQRNLRNTTCLIRLLCLGLTSYAGSHASDFDRSCLGQAYPAVFRIGAFDDLDRVITLQREKLSCLNAFVGGSVWVFNSSREELQNGGQPRDENELAISTSLEELADLWGPAWTKETDDFQQINHINVERGFIYQPRVIPFRFREQLCEGEVACHWASWNDIEGFDAVPFPKYARLLIGIDWDGEESQFQVNPKCSKTSGQLYTNLKSRNEEMFLGTDRTRFSLESHTLNLGVSHLVNLAYQPGFKRIPGRTVKAMLILDWSGETPTPLGLDAIFGLEVSACTGNARRIKLWEIFKVKEIHDFVEVTMADHLPDSLLTSGFWDAFRTDFDAFLRKWSADSSFRDASRHVIRKVIQTLCDTGIDGDKQLRAWWPDAKGYRAFKIKSDQNQWVRMLKDSDTTAVFAVISSNCFQYFNREGITCSSAVQSKKRTVLRTAVNLHEGSVKTRRFRALKDPRRQSVRIDLDPNQPRTTTDTTLPSSTPVLEPALQTLEEDLSKLENAPSKGKNDFQRAIPAAVQHTLQLVMIMQHLHSSLSKLGTVLSRANTRRHLVPSIARFTRITVKQMTMPIAKIGNLTNQFFRKVK